MINDDLTNMPLPVSRRTVIKLLAAAPLAHFAIACSDVERAAQRAADSLASAVPFTPQFFSRDELDLVRQLADIIIPRDARSGSASDAGVPEFMDFIMMAYPSMQEPMREGLKWLESECATAFGKPFAQTNDAERTAILDRIAYPKRAAAKDEDGVAFFSRFRDLTASGFWSSRIGVEDLDYQGNKPQARWTGCPPAAVKKARTIQSPRA